MAPDRHFWQQNLADVLSCDLKGWEAVILLGVWMLPHRQIKRKIYGARYSKLLTCICTKLTPHAITGEIFLRSLV